MFKNYFKPAWRSLKKNKFFSSLNILGLAIGMAVFMLIAQYVHFERSYENFIPNRENIYRVDLTAYRSNEVILATAQNYPCTGPAIKNDIPEVTSYARLFNIGYRNFVVVTNENAKPQPIAFRQRNFFIADSSFLPMMGYEMLKGNARTALAEPNAAVISEKYAKMYFGDTDPIGRTLRMQDDDLNDKLVTVTGIFKDIPPNTHLKFDLLVSFRTLFAPSYDQNWKRTNLYTYVQVRPGTDPKTLVSKLPGVIHKYKSESNESNERQILSLQPVSNIHLHSDLAEEPETNGDNSIVFFINLIGIFVLIIAWINYINLSTARSVSRAKEVGVYKILGISKFRLILQFFAEAALVNLFALILAYCFVMLVLPFFNIISGLSLNNSYLNQLWFIKLLFILWIAGSFLSGFYPALVLSSFKPVVVLKGKFKSDPRGVLLRKSLVVSQFVAAVILIAGTLIIYSQVDFMLNRNIGMNISQVLVTEHPGISPGGRDDSVYRSAIDFFRDELKKDPSIEAVTTSLTIPGKQREYKDIITKTGSTDSIIVRVNTADYNFGELFRMKFLAGRDFSKDFPGDPDNSVIITASAAHLLGYREANDAIGKSIGIEGYRRNRIIIGVVNDYHQLSFKKPLEPSIFYCSPYGGLYYSLRVHTDHLSQTIQHIRQSWVKAFPGNPFEYFFLDDYFNKQYLNEQKFEKLFTVFAALAIMISCMGLLGLSAYTATQRVKEIGIRKVLGASVMNITSMLSKDFLKLVIIAVFIATPIVYIVMNKWLQGFAYRINISWWVLIIAGALALFIALITISFQSIKAAIANPVKSLRTE